jgi:hypothetical protein
MHILFNILCTLIHVILSFGCFIISVTSNNINVLFVLLILMSIAKYSYYIFNRCILTLGEYNKYYSVLAKIFSNTLTTKLNETKMEEIFINFIILIVLTKILFLILYKHYV